MGKSKSKIEWIPVELSNNISDLTKKANLPHKIDAFNFMNNIQPIILGETSVRLAKSKEIIKQIDVRYTFKVKK